MAHAPQPERTGHGERAPHAHPHLPGNIRPACAADAACLPALERDAARAFAAVPGLGWLVGGDVLPVATHLANIATQTCWVAADASGRLLGFISAQPYGDDLHIQEMSVARAAQGHGLGRHLLHTACTAAGRMGLRGVTLTTFMHIPWNAPFYATAGFCIVPPNALDARLASLLAQEKNEGLATTPRCAMRLNLGAAAQCVSK